MLTTGIMAPDFTLPDKDGNPVTLSDFRGRKVVIYFYPKDNTAGCTRQAQGYQGFYEKFQAAGIEILGISRDSQASHRKFADKYGLTFPLLSDPDLQVIQQYGVWAKKVLYGKEVQGTVRSSFIVDETGLLIYANTKCRSNVDPIQVAAFLGFEP